MSPLLSGQPTESPVGSASPPATAAPQFAPTLAHNPEIVNDADLLRFLAELEARGVSPLSVDDSQNPILLPAPGLAYRLDSGHLHVHVYPSAAEAHQRAQQVPAELAQSIADWVGTPHFFECGRLLAVYFGDDAVELAAVGGACAVVTPGLVPTPMPASGQAPTEMPVPAPGTPTVATIERPLDWRVVSDPAIRASGSFDFDGRSLLFWNVLSAEDPASLAIVIQTNGALREIHRSARGFSSGSWIVLQAAVDGDHAVWLEVQAGDDPRIYRLWAYEIARGAPRLIAESQPFPEPHVPALALDGDRAVVRAVAPDGATCFWANDLPSGAAREPVCSPGPDLLYWDPYLRGSLLTYTVQAAGLQGCRYIQQTDLDTGEIQSYQALSCRLGLVAAADEALLFWPETVPAEAGGEVTRVRLRALDAAGQTYDLGTQSPLGRWEVCAGRAYWLATAVVDAGAVTDQIRAWAPGGPVEVLHRAPVDDHILGPVCAGNWIAFANQRTGETLAAQVSGELPALATTATP
jgi:hypothetical protein